MTHAKNKLKDIFVLVFIQHKIIDSLSRIVDIARWLQTAVLLSLLLLSLLLPKEIKFTCNRSLPIYS